MEVWNMQVLVLLAMVSSTLGVTSLIMAPVRSSGDEVGLIFVPGASIKGEAYQNTAAAIQQASQLRLWVALTGNYTFDTPNPLELPSAIQDAITKLSAAGMKGDNYVGVAHSLGGVFLAPYAKSSSLKAVVLLGSYLTKTNSLSNYPVPVMTLSGELDGQARITRIAVEYEHLLQLVQNSTDAVYRKPVINLKGVSHAQFASGPMPPQVVKYDLKPDVNESVAHALIGSQISNFLTVTFNSPAAAVAAAKIELENSFKDSGLRFQPLLDVRDVDTNGTTSSVWSVYLQDIIAGDLASRTQITNTIEATTEFILSKPDIHKNGNDVTIKTTTHIEYATNAMDISTIPESPAEVDIKFKSYDAIQQALSQSSLFDHTTTCRDLNQLAVSIALIKSTDQARSRYTSRGRPIILQDDVLVSTGLEWVNGHLKLTEDDAGLHVQSVALNVPITSPIFPGNFYCKVLSPYRAMEWINVDSLRAHKPTTD